MAAWIIGISAVALMVAIWRILVFQRGVSMSPRVVSYREVRRRNLWRTSGIVMVLALGGAAAFLTGNTIPGWIFCGAGIGGVALWVRLYVTRAGQCAQCTYATPCPHREVMS